MSLKSWIDKQVSDASASVTSGINNVTSGINMPSVKTEVGLSGTTMVVIGVILLVVFTVFKRR